MAENKIKVLNLTGSTVSINLTALNGKVVPINTKGFALLSTDELAYVRNTSTAFERGTLKVDEKSTVPEEIDIPSSPNALTDEDINTLIKKPVKQVEIALAEIDSINVVRNILAQAKEQDKSVKLVEAVEARLEQLLG
jgi:hypothetical protein